MTTVLPSPTGAPASFGLRPRAASAAWQLPWPVAVTHGFALQAARAWAASQFVGSHPSYPTAGLQQRRWRRGCRGPMAGRDRRRQAPAFSASLTAASTRRVGSPRPPQHHQVHRGRRRGQARDRAGPRPDLHADGERPGARLHGCTAQRCLQRSAAAHGASSPPACQTHQARARPETRRRTHAFGLPQLSFPQPRFALLAASAGKFARADAACPSVQVFDMSKAYTRTAAQSVQFTVPCGSE